MNMRHQVLTVSLASLVLGTSGITALVGVNSAQADSLRTQAIAQLNGQPQSRPQRGDGLAAAAAQLGISEAEFRTALGLPAEPVEPDFAAAAALLNITEDELMATLRSTHRSGERRGPRPDFAAVAEQYGVSEADLIDALGVPAERPVPNVAAAAETLGISETDIWQALRANRPGRGGFGGAGGPCVNGSGAGLNN